MTTVSWIFARSDGLDDSLYLGEVKERGKIGDDIKEIGQLSDHAERMVSRKNDQFHHDFLPVQYFTILILTDWNTKLMFFTLRRKILIKKVGNMTCGNSVYYILCTYGNDIKTFQQCIIILKKINQIQKVKL